MMATVNNRHMLDFIVCLALADASLDTPKARPSAHPVRGTAKRRFRNAAKPRPFGADSDTSPDENSRFSDWLVTELTKLNYRNRSKLVLLSKPDHPRLKMKKTQLISREKRRQRIRAWLRRLTSEVAQQVQAECHPISKSCAQAQRRAWLNMNEAERQHHSSAGLIRHILRLSLAETGVRPEVRKMRRLTPRSKRKAA